MIRKRLNIVVMLMFISIFAVYAQLDSKEIRIDFRVNRADIDTTYMDNARRFREIITYFEHLNADSLAMIKSVSFCGTASPEGSYQLNKRLASKRLKTLEDLVLSKVSIADSLISRNDEYISWEYLAEMVSASDLEHKDAILEVINGKWRLVDFPGGRHIDSRVLALQHLYGGKPWKALLKDYFPKMRNAVAILVSFSEPPRMTLKPVSGLPHISLPADTFNVVADVIAPNAVEIIAPQDWRRELLVKTNLLGWPMLMSNIAVEVDLAKHWSVSVPVYYSALNYFKRTIKFRTLALQPEARFWFNENNDGWFVGAHFGMAYFNIATNGDYRYQDHGGSSPMLGGGFNAGYRLPVTADERWKLEFSLGVGVYSLHYDKFQNYGYGLLVDTCRKTYFGLDQASVTLSYTFDLSEIWP